MAIRAGPDPLLDERAGCHCPPVERPANAPHVDRSTPAPPIDAERDAGVAVPKLFGDVNRIVPERRP